VNELFGILRNASYPLLRVSLGIVLGWIGALKFVDPSPVVGLLGASLSFLAFPAFVYLLGVAEVVVALALLANLQVKWAGLASMGLFVGTILILIIAPKVAYGDAGFPLLQLPGEFLLKDLVLFAASATVSGMAAARELAAQRPAELRRAA
jgi:uncharacterized membrane protein YkgB